MSTAETSERAGFSVANNGRRRAPRTFHRPPHSFARPAAIDTTHRPELHVELAKRAIRRSGWRLIIFQALKPSCGIHASSLLQASDNGCLWQNFSNGWPQDTHATERHTAPLRPAWQGH